MYSPKTPTKPHINIIQPPIENQSPVEIYPSPDSFYPPIEKSSILSEKIDFNYYWHQVFNDRITVQPFEIFALLESINRDHFLNNDLSIKTKIVNLCKGSTTVEKSKAIGIIKSTCEETNLNMQFESRDMLIINADFIRKSLDELDSIHSSLKTSFLNIEHDLKEMEQKNDHDLHNLKTLSMSNDKISEKIRIMKYEMGLLNDDYKVIKQQLLNENNKVRNSNYSQSLLTSVLSERDEQILIKLSLKDSILKSRSQARKSSSSDTTINRSCYMLSTESSNAHLSYYCQLFIMITLCYMFYRYN